MAYAMQFQYGNPHNFYAKDKRMLRIGKLFDMDGGVFNDPQTGHVRIDYVSHHIRAMAAWVLGDKPGSLPSSMTANRNAGRAF